MKYIYYDPATMQVMAEFDTPNLSHQKNWVQEGYERAIVPAGMVVNRDCKITRLDGDVCVAVEAHVNSVQPIPDPPTRLDALRNKLKAGELTYLEINEMLRLERKL